MSIDKALLTERKRIGLQIKSAREEKGLSWYAVVQASGLKYNVVQSIENGDSSYTIDSLLKYAQAVGYNISIDQLSKTRKSR